METVLFLVRQIYVNAVPREEPLGLPSYTYLHLLTLIYTYLHYKLSINQNFSIKLKKKRGEAQLKNVLHCDWYFLFQSMDPT